MKYYRYLQPSPHAPLLRTDLRSPLAIPANQNRPTDTMSELSRFESACPTIKISAIDILTFPLTPRLSLRFAAALGMRPNILQLETAPHCCPWTAQYMYYHSNACLRT